MAASLAGCSSFDFVRVGNFNPLLSDKISPKCSFRAIDKLHDGDGAEVILHRSPPHADLKICYVSNRQCTTSGGCKGLHEVHTLSRYIIRPIGSLLDGRFERVDALEDPRTKHPSCGVTGVFSLYIKPAAFTAF